MTDDHFLHHQIAASSGTSEESSMFVRIDTTSGKSTVIVTRTIKETFPITEIAKARELHNWITRSGRGVPDLKSTAD